ncbi:sensor histidine kinase [Salinibacter ruber]|uniref:sensor histidine kinase n=1 Tax=Salinibacter ruber TaxID=146919 RepID=UPI002073AB03|nr:ATP-binding protein [Salinibacter ruber]MCS4155538.1 signal transduction histidine kinase [Salinibacter ruber]
MTHETLYWVVMSVAYALAAAGYLMLLEVFLKAGARTGPLAMLTGLTALLAALNVIGHVEPALLDITHEPLGVAVFAVGLLFAYETQFSVVQLTGNVEEPNLTIGREGRIRGLGGGIEEIVPALGGKPLGEETLGRPLEEVLPGLAKTIEEREAVWRASFDGGEVEECQDSEPASRPQPASGPQHASSTQSKEGSRMAEEAGRAGGDTQPREDVQPVGHLNSEEVSSVDEISGVEDDSGVEDASGMEDASYLGTGARPEEDCRYFQVVEVGTQAHGETRTVVLSDITERKRRTERLEEAKKQAELSKLEAEEASRMKSAMLANMSHEIRTPLTGVIGFAEAIGEETEGNETGGGDTEEGDTEEEDTGGEDAEKEGRVAHFAGLIEDSGRRLLDTLDAVLNLSKLEAGKMSLERKPVDLAGLKIVLQNLLSNAIKYTEEGDVTVRVYREENTREEKGQEEANEEGVNKEGSDQEMTSPMTAILEVEDTGIGMDPEVAGRLFEPFRQASEGMSREYEGTGIGLAVTKRATEKIGGSIEVDTQKGEGTCMTVRLPQAGRMH